MSSPQDAPPAIQDDEGSADEWVARVIILVPFVLILLTATVVAALIFTGYISLNINVGGEIPAEAIFTSLIRPVAQLAVLLIGFTYILALMKEYGANPVVWVVNAIGRMARNYNPEYPDQLTGEDGDDEN